MKPRAAMVNENEVRAAAGLTMVAGAVAFSYAYFDRQYIPLQVIATLFFAEFLIRVTVGLRYSPFGVLARAMTSRRRADWVSARPKRFAWSLGLGMAFAMTVITNSGIRGYLPRTMCLICLTLMWMESALGLCLGCKIHGLMVRQRGWTSADVAGEVCVDCVRDAVGSDVPAGPVSAPTNRSIPRAPVGGTTGIATPTRGRRGRRSRGSL
jgi:Domain of unknown function (DUF4395)